MAKNTLADLKDHLFEALERLKGKDDPREIEKAKAICEVSQTIINAAKVEVQYLNVTGKGYGGKFFGDQPSEPRAIMTGKTDYPQGRR